ncbi:RT0821/Lpp0805 family surface protein [Pseudoxanthobacter soli]|nr:RT0821/Lpp0805 family surface protein [Pseudoxanthobacter soli]
MMLRHMPFGSMRSARQGHARAFEPDAAAVVGPMSGRAAPCCGRGRAARAPHAVSVVVFLSVLGGCSTTNLNFLQATPQPTPAADDALSDPAAVAFAAALPMDGTVARALGDTDRKAAAKAEIEALELSKTGAPVTWKNPDTDFYGVVVPGPTYVVNNQECRDYTHTIYADGQSLTLRGRACRGEDGTWRPLT